MSSAEQDTVGGAVPRWIASDVTQWVGDTTVPTPRSFHSCTLLIEEDILVVFGGVTGDSEHPRFLNDVWVKAPHIGKRWRNDLVVFSGSKNQPSPRCRHTAVALDKGLFVFGGASSTGDAVDANVYVLELLGARNQFRWIRLMTMGDQPCARFGHCAERLSDNTFIVFGGRAVTDGTELKDFYSFDSFRNVWFKIEMHGLIKPPPGTDYSLFSFGPSSLLLIGVRPGDDEDEFVDHPPAENIVAWVLTNQNQKRQWSCIPIRFSGQRANTSRQISSSTFGQRLCLAETTILEDLGASSSSIHSKDDRTHLSEQNSDESLSQPRLRTFSTSERRRRTRNVAFFFPADRWFPAFVRAKDDYIYLLGGMKKKTGERPGLRFVWRFSMSRLTVSSSSYWAAWECIRMRDAMDGIHSRVGWSVVEVPCGMLQEYLTTNAEKEKDRGVGDTLDSLDANSHSTPNNIDSSAFVDPSLADPVNTHGEEAQNVSAIVLQVEEGRYRWDINDKVLLVFGGTQVANSYLDDMTYIDDNLEAPAATSFNSAMMMMMNATGEEGFESHRKQMQIIRRITDAPMMLGFEQGEEIAMGCRHLTMRPFTDDDIMREGNETKNLQQNRIAFATETIAVRFMHDSLFVQVLPIFNAGGNRLPTTETSLHSFKVFDANVIWAVSWDLSLFVFCPSSQFGKPQIQTSGSDESKSSSSPGSVTATVPPAPSTLRGTWSRIIKPIVPPSPSTGTQFEFIDSELSVLWPDANREGFAMERFSPNQFYLKHRQFHEAERAFDGDVLVLMGGMRRSSTKELTKAAKLLGVKMDTTELASANSAEKLRRGSTATMPSTTSSLGSGSKFRNTASAAEEEHFMNDVWIAYSSYSSRKNYFSPPSVSLCSWKKLWPPSELVSVNADEALFEGRAKHSLSALPSLGLLVAFGGITNNERPPQTSLILIDFTVRSRDFTHAILTVPVQSGTEPSPRYNHAAAATTDEETPRLVICGGRGMGGAMLNDVFVWEVCTGLWTEVKLEIPIQSLGWLHYSDGEFFFFGQAAKGENETAKQVINFSLH